MMDVLHLNKESFEKLTSQTEKAVLIDFWAPWCGPCRMIAPVLEEIAAEREDLIIGKINVDDNMELAAGQGIDSIPALFFYKNGKLEKKLVGCMDKDTLLAKLGI